MKHNYKKRILLLGGLILGSLTANSQITTYNYTGVIDTYTVPPGVTRISIQAYGAQGGNDNGGLGASIFGEFNVTPGEVLNVVVGQQGFVNNCGGTDASGGGGGGSFVWNPTDATLPMVAAGGGGGGNENWAGVCVDGIDGQAGEDGASGAEGLALGGVGGEGGAGDAPSGTGSGGGGWLSAGQNSTWGDGCTGGATIPTFEGGVGATGFGPGGEGGFGGGGGAVCGCGGGGGYSGGAGGNGSSCRAGGGGGGSYNAGDASVNVSGVQSGNGQVVITVLCDPLTVSVSDDVICLGESFILDASSSGAITWDGGVINGEPFTPASVGTVTYTATSDDPGECGFSVDIEVLESPVLSYAITEEVYGADGEIDLTVSGGAPGYTFDWDNDGTGDFDDTEDLTGLVGGSYTVVVKDEADCATTETVVLNSQVGVYENEKLIFSVYPNPTADQFTIAAEGVFSYNIVGMNGAVLLNGTGNNLTHVSLADFEKGIYLIKLNAQNKVHVLEIIKQ